MTNEERKVIELALEALEEIALAGMSGTGQESDEAMTAWHARQAWKFIGIAARALGPIKEALAQPEQEPVAWKLVPIEPTRKMLEAMDECSMEGYDEHLYAGHAASVYMAAVDVAPTPPQPEKPDQDEVDIRSRLYQRIHELETQLAQPDQEPVAWRYKPVRENNPRWEYTTKHPLDMGDGYLRPTLVEYCKCIEPLYAKEKPKLMLEKFREMKDLLDDPTPPQRTWVGLTDEEAQQVFKRHNCDISKDLAGILARAIEAQLKDKNHA